MKKLDKGILMVFSFIVLIEGIVVCLLVSGILEYSFVDGMIKNLFFSDPMDKVILGFSIICIVFALKALLWGTPATKSEEKSGRDVLMQNDNGRLMISVTTIESLVNSVVSGFNSVQDTKTNIVVDEENNVSVLVNLIVTKDVIIKSLTLEIQNKIKEAIKKTSDLDVKEVNVRIKNVVSVPEVENKE